MTTPSPAPRSRRMVILWAVALGVVIVAGTAWGLWRVREAGYRDSCGKRLRQIHLGCRTYARNNDGETPLTYALRKNYQELAEIIRNNGGTE